MNNNMPLTVKRSIELLGLCLLGLLVVTGKTVVMPLLMAIFLSILLMPIYRMFRKIRLPESLAILFSIVVLAIFVLLIIWFIGYQVGMLVADYPTLQKNTLSHLSKLSNWINEKMNFSTQEQLEMLQGQSGKMMDNMGGVLSGAAVSLSSVFIFFGLLPIYIFLIMYYRNLLLRFGFMWFSKDDHTEVARVMHETQTIVKSYLVGLLIQIIYITVLLGGLLLLLGIKHALLIGVIFAILNLIPYVGALIGNLIGVLLTLSSSQDFLPVIEVLLAIAAVQFLDNNILMPRIVGSKIKINALVSILGVVIGGALDGIPGMFLSMPVIAVLKVMFDHTHHFKHWGILLGEERPVQSPLSKIKLFPARRGRPRKEDS